MKNWEDVYLDVCSAMAQRSKDPRTKIGACVVDAKNALVATGFNGPPRTCDDRAVPLDGDKYPWIIHAEHNAILFALAARGAYMLDGCTLYTSGEICSHCMLIAAHVGVDRVVCGATKPVMVDAADAAIRDRIAAACGVEVTL